MSKLELARLLARPGAGATDLAITAPLYAIAYKATPAFEWADGRVVVTPATWSPWPRR